MASAQRSFRSRDEYKKSKELEEARKAGQIAPEQDEEGNDINPHIPQYIAKSPWYLKNEAPSLKHQANKTFKKDTVDPLGVWYPRGKQGAANVKFKKGACENCGATTHDKKSCMERPRKVGARFRQQNLGADEVFVDVKLGWEGKRDRWNGYDPRHFDSVLEEHEKIEKERRDLQQEMLDRNRKQMDGDKAEGNSANESDSEGEHVEQGFRLRADGEIITQEKDVDTKGTTRNLRIREDTAKYLRNLALDSAYYDPKTRSMRQDPTPHVDINDKDFAGDNFVRYSGDVSKFAQLELHALKASSEGRDVPHLQADPSLAEMLHKEYQSRKENLEKQRREHILQTYGRVSQEEPAVEDDAGLELDPSLLEQSEAYVEYTPDGRVLNYLTHSLPISRYEEDKLENNHTMIWGSFYQDRKWGYGCCQSLTRNSYCTGKRGIEALALAKQFADRHADWNKAEKVRDTEKGSTNAKEDDRKEKLSEELRDRELNEDPDERQLEEYRRKRVRVEDPMSAP
uniref:Pre-mRNA-splicing factor SLU7 n=1 Tax=Timspurckia oligopyrenoides TaxID=708627 RepID=A0A6T6L670_9RHOD|mmetsp:Transcript_12146/g.21957  ORF Transcript_12146/g.21957 Transcript_12146/m.21957 type:complete len:513 (+) Transcript_12146:46-1584(+)